MGASAAVTRVLVVAMVRDLFEGEAMARIMSLVFMVFMVVPVLAPSVGQLILLFAPWRWIFLVLGAYGAGMLALGLDAAAGDAAPRISPVAALGAKSGPRCGETLTERQSLGYTLALTAMFGGLIAYIASIQQIVFDVFDAPRRHRPGVRRRRRADGAGELVQLAGSSSASACGGSAMSGVIAFVAITAGARAGRGRASTSLCGCSSSSRA